jgi:hypothetical protein
MKEKGMQTRAVYQEGENQDGGGGGGGGGGSGDHSKWLSSLVGQFLDKPLPFFFFFFFC